jgi:hypothetical protein
MLFGVLNTIQPAWDNWEKKAELIFSTATPRESSQEDIIRVKCYRTFSHP